MQHYWRPWDNPSNLLKSVESKFCCDVCKVSFKRESEYVRHKSTHTQSAIRCKICKKRFTREDNLVRHLKLAHSSERKYFCRHCSKPLSRKDALHRHESTCLMKRPRLDIPDISFQQEVTIFNPQETHVNLSTIDKTFGMATDKNVTMDQYNNRALHNHLTRFQESFFGPRNSTVISVNGIDYAATELFADFETFRSLLFNGISKWNQCNIIEFRVIHRFSTKTRTTNIVSNQIFDYFIPDKLFFTGIDSVGLKKLAKFGQTVGDFNANISCFDYILLQDQRDFQVICKQALGNLHLIEYTDNQLQLISSSVSTVNIDKFIETNKFCYDFPTCNCEFGADDYAIEFIFQIICQDDQMVTRKVPINIGKVERRLLQILKLQEIIELFDIKQMFSVTHQTSECLDAWKRNENQFHISLKVCTEQLVEILLKYFYLQCEEAQRPALKRIAAHTFFPNLEMNVENLETETELPQNYFEIGLIYQMEDRILLSSKAVTWFLIAELIFDDKESESVNWTSDPKFLDYIFHKCFIPYQMILTCPSENSVEKVEIKITDSFTFKNSMFASFLDLLIDKNSEPKGLITLIEESFTIKIAQKWILACVNGNYLNLLKLLTSFGMHSKLFESQTLFLQAIYNCNVAIVDLVTKQYAKHNREHLLAAEIELVEKRCSITPLHISAFRGNHSVLKYLLQYDNFKDCLQKDNLNDIPHYCVFNTYGFDAGNILDRIQILELLVNQRPNILHLKNRYNQTALLAPYVHVDLIIHLINLGSDVTATDMESQNILHKSAKYVTPWEYHKLVRTLYMMENPEIFNVQNKRKQTPLLVAVVYLELLDSTIEYFLEAKVDFNAIDIEGNSILICAIRYKRSARVLDALTRAGADFRKRAGNFNGTVLHFAVIYGNLSALGYFIAKGCDVNATDQRRYTPLTLSLYVSKPFTHDIVQLLVRHGADVNVNVDVDGLGCTPLSYALRRYSEGEIENRTVELLKAAGARLSVESSSPCEAQLNT